MDDLHGLGDRAKELRRRLSEFIAGFGRELVPDVSRLQDELAQIEEHLQALGEQLPGEEAG